MVVRNFEDELNINRSAETRSHPERKSELSVQREWRQAETGGTKSVQTFEI
jgi:hypothetical protein